MISEKTVVGEGTEYPLKGLLTLPDDLSEKVPAVVLVHGSGASNMDEKVMKLTPFKDIAEGLAAHGIAAIRYDKRSFAHALKMMKKTVTVWEETVEDAIRAADLLRNDDRIDSARIFIIGHSMGAMLAPRIDAQGGNFAGLIMMAGTPFRMEDIVVRQLKQARNGGNFLMNAIVGLEERIYGRKFEGLYDMPVEETKKKKFASSMTLYYFREMGEKTAADYLLESDKPALIMQGEKDFQVLADQDFAEFKKLLADRKNVEYRLYENLNHLFVNSVYNDILKAGKEYAVEQHIGENVISDIAAFINSH